MDCREATFSRDDAAGRQAQTAPLFRLVNLRASFKRISVSRKRKDSNGLDLIHYEIESLESYQLDDLPADGSLVGKWQKLG